MLSVSGVYLQLVFGKGWTAPTILMLKTVVDPKISSLSVALFLFLTNIVNTIASSLMGNLTDTYDIQPATNPRQYGNLVTSMTVIPCLLSIPFFLYAGKRIMESTVESEAYNHANIPNYRDVKQFALTTYDCIELLPV